MNEARLDSSATCGTWTATICSQNLSELCLYGTKLTTSTISFKFQGADTCDKLLGNLWLEDDAFGSTQKTMKCKQWSKAHENVPRQEKGVNYGSVNWFCANAQEDHDSVSVYSLVLHENDFLGMWAMILMYRALFNGVSYGALLPRA